MEHVPVVVVGGGQAGLAASYELTRAGLEHLVLDRGRVGETWRGHWDSFCLVTPNWSVRLPGQHYDGSDPGGFMPRDESLPPGRRGAPTEIVARLTRHAAGFGSPVREGVDVNSVESRRGGGFVLRTSTGDSSS